MFNVNHDMKLTMYFFYVVEYIIASHSNKMNDITEDLEMFQTCPSIIENEREENDAFMIEVHLARHKSSTWVFDIGCGVR